MTVTLYSPSGEAVCGEATISSHMRSLCNDIGGTILDDTTGQRIYPLED